MQAVNQHKKIWVWSNMRLSQCSSCHKCRMHCVPATAAEQQSLLAQHAPAAAASAFLTLENLYGISTPCVHNKVRANWFPPPPPPHPTPRCPFRQWHLLTSHRPARGHCSPQPRPSTQRDHESTQTLVDAASPRVPSGFTHSAQTTPVMFIQ